MSHPEYGRVQVPDSPAEIARSLYVHDEATGPLKTVDHEVPIAVLDQSDLIAQQIHCTKFIPGCKKDPDALGSCTANTVIEVCSDGMTEAKLLELAAKLIGPHANAPKSYKDAAGLERAAIAFYHACTDQTGNAGEEWPPEDCGSSGPYMYSELKRLGVVTGQRIASNVTSICSLLQTGPVAMGGPFFYSWEEPDAAGFIDGKGTAADMKRAQASGLAGGHETTITAIEKLTMLSSGVVDPFNTVFRVRNHWTKGWGDNGCFRVHGSTLGFVGSQSDFRQFTFA